MLTDTLAQFLSTYFDPKDLLAYLLLMMGIDIITGIVASARHRRINSNIAWAGVARKAGTVVAVFFVMAVEPLVKQMSGTDVGVSWMVTLGFVGAEVMSIIENLGRAGVPLPSGLTDAFSRIAPPRPSAPPAPKRPSRKRAKPAPPAEAAPQE
jgi:toxin secretion/phage lysis holin